VVYRGCINETIHYLGIASVTPRESTVTIKYRYEELNTQRLRTAAPKVVGLHTRDGRALVLACSLRTEPRPAYGVFDTLRRACCIAAANPDIACSIIVSLAVTESRKCPGISKIDPGRQNTS
jgi:hypothetical protein